MAQQSAFRTMCKVLATAAGLGLASFLYSLWIIGISSVGFFYALGTTLFVFSVTVFGGVVTYLE
jgi:hypothetical protein